MAWQVVIKLTLCAVLVHFEIVTGYYVKKIDCGPYGFNCESGSKVRLCEGENLLGPTFLCPPNTVCNEDSSEVCEKVITYTSGSNIKSLNCRRNDRLADPSVPGCKGYILCIPNKNRFQGIKFKCSGNTIFNGYKRACSSPNTYKCPTPNSTRTTTDSFENRRIDNPGDYRNPAQNNVIKPIECKNYKFSVTQDGNPTHVRYFCPQRPPRGESNVLCTIFSNQFCVTLERDDYDQFMQSSGALFRKPRT